MTAPFSYGFRPARAADIALIDGWMRAPHMAEWWGAEARFDAGHLADPRVDVRIVTLAGREIGYMQDYDPHGWDGHPFAGLPPGARGVDQFIGPPELLGQGHGPRFIAERMAALFAAGAPAIGTDPHPDNARAIAACRKAGFAVAGPPMDSRWGRYVPMVALRPGPAARPGWLTLWPDPARGSAICSKPGRPRATEPFRSAESADGFQFEIEPEFSVGALFHQRFSRGFVGLGLELFSKLRDPVFKRDRQRSGSVFLHQPVDHRVLGLGQEVERCARCRQILELIRFFRGLHGQLDCGVQWM